ncbi:Hypothetical predicted protein [Paramuricea clavata]|uniref:Uncharacterized protein n=1 Tax=Paramuricea clavata TaxID=317549 RepID=A0A6S7G0R8_PARCT|nr:Hypothetical predicted protein [Paramuricea clavata]
MGDTVVHITIYVLNEKAKSEREKYKEGYCVDDNDKSILFSPIIFPECVGDWAVRDETIIEVLSNLLCSRLEDFTQTFCVLPDVVAKVNAIIKYIENHLDIYGGVGVVYNECP